ncbi:hypothetical protein BJY24_002031 [Nocardia transvalensis]|uniref:Uncharacterized protein n=1 Tax=Nocardia transvalensis TaxID=37333 RepID=A0A7W9PBS3_9NOCA|nr:hypothetical protein [Nocardia transvalensis]MBB5913164.1 hypothetical protein [Nocardia transvalensis]
MRMLMLVLAIVGALVGAGAASSVAVIAERGAPAVPSPPEPVERSGYSCDQQSEVVAVAISYSNSNPWELSTLPDPEAVALLGAVAGALVGVAAGYWFGRTGWTLRWERTG